MARQYEPSEISQLINQVAEKYFPGDEQFRKVLHSLVFTESSYDNNKKGDGGRSIGLLQAHTTAGRGIGHSKEQLSDPLYNLELGMKEIAPAYRDALAKGFKGSNVATYVSDVAQRPAKGNEKIAGKNYGVDVGEGGKVVFPNAELTTDQLTPTPAQQLNEGKVLGESQQVAYPTPTPQQEKLVEVKPGLTVNLNTDIGKRIADTYGYKETPVIDKAKQIQQEYNKKFGGWKSMFGGLLNPKPAFSAEQETTPAQQQSTEIQNGGNFLDNAQITQNFGAKTFGFYGAGGHEGTDFRAKTGTPIKGYAGWVVDYAGQGESYYGNKIVIRNPRTGETLEFAHLDSVDVQKGDTLGAGQVMGTTGASGIRPDGKAQQQHLHVNYYSADGKKKNVTDFIQSSQIGAANFTMNPIPKTGVTQNAKVGYVKPGEQYTGKSVGTYQIKPGDTLSALAKQYKTTVADFQRQNPSITNPNMIRAGANISIPSTPTATSSSGGYTIRSGDTLSAIAKNLGTSVNDLVRKNGIADANKIMAGTKLKV